MCDALRYVGKGGRGGVRVYSLPGPLAIGSELLHAGRAVCREFFNFIKVTLMRSPSHLSVACRMGITRCTGYRCSAGEQGGARRP